jgi:hypothetical protein
MERETRLEFTTALAIPSGIILIVAFTFAGEDLSPNLNATIRA